MTNGKGLEEKRSWPNLGTIPAFSWRDWGKPLKISISLASATASEHQTALPLDQSVYSYSRQGLKEIKIQKFIQRMNRFTIEYSMVIMTA
jgi:hypothetical protein